MLYCHPTVHTSLTPLRLICKFYFVEIHLPRRQKDNVYLFICGFDPQIDGRNISFVNIQYLIHTWKLHSMHCVYSQFIAFPNCGCRESPFFFLSWTNRLKVICSRCVVLFVFLKIRNSRHKRTFYNRLISCLSKNITLRIAVEIFAALN